MITNRLTQFDAVMPSGVYTQVIPKVWQSVQLYRCKAGGKEMLRNYKYICKSVAQPVI
jgi:hypothetical protein